MKSNGVFSLLVFAISIILFSGFFYYQPTFAEPFVNGLKIATSGNHVYAVWQKHSDAPLVKRDVYFRTSSDNGVTFGDTIRLNDDTTQSNPWGDGGILERVPFVSASENHVYVLWDEFGTDVPTPKWYFVVSDDYGIHFRRPILLDGGDSTASTSMIASGNNVYVFWINGT
ncbi:MAG: exo-alpha-sialidase, partial [Patescibacteria group bacterium]|nr:exo-alpha-sialidase [Patescibacteria group bacterium]